MKNDKGFTLLEAMIAVFILAVGIMAAAGMQIRAIDANNNGMARTMANSVALSVMEELKRLPFDDPNLINTNGNGLVGLNNGSDSGGRTVNPALADHQFLPANFPNFQNTYVLAGGKVVDNSGRSYQIFWNTDKSPLVVGSTPAFCKISIFVYWRTVMGQQHLTLTSLKYNNNSI